MRPQAQTFIDDFQSHDQQVHVYHPSEMETLHFFLPLVAMIILLWGCDQSPVLEEKPSTENSTQAVPSVIRFDQLPDVAHSKIGQGSDVNQQLKSISRVVAKALANDDVRRYVHRRVMEKFDGETNVLWKQLNQMSEAGVPSVMQQAAQRANGKPWTGQLLREGQGTLESALGQANKLDAAIDRAGRVLGGPVHLYWPNAEKFDGNRAPLVTFTPASIDADEIDGIEAFDAAGNLHVVDEQTTKERSVIVLSNNERVDEEKMTIRAKSQDEEDTGDGGGSEDDGPGDGGGGGGGSDALVGDDYSSYPGHLALDWVRFYDPHEGWPNGGPEFYAYFANYNAETGEAIGQYQTTNLKGLGIDRSDCDGRKLTIEKTLFPWDGDPFPTLNVQWMEQDQNDITNRFWISNIPFELPSWAEVPYKIVDYYIDEDKDDDLMAYGTMDFDDTVKYYGTADPDFYMTRIDEN
jgi:hypothetical protein